jgi:hypothetical protein
VTTCYSYQHFCSLGLVPPRTVGRADPQVPVDAKLGPARYGKIGAFYFYAEGSKDDPAFGFFDIELSVQALTPARLRVELYCVADGYQTARGVSGSPLAIALMAGEAVVATVPWRYHDVLCGHADPMSFSADIDGDAAQFAAVDRIALLAVEGRAAPCA